MIFSFHTEMDERYCSKNWQTEYFSNDLILSKRYSPIIWKDGRRLKANFERADAIVIDVDDGKTIHQVQELLHEMACLIAPTKNHMRPKNGKTCERFRVILPLSKPITDVVNFEYTTLVWIKRLGGDIQAKDGARMYAPSTSIEWDALTMPVKICELSAPPKPEYKPVEQGKMTGWLLSKLSQGFYTQGKRNHEIYGVARELNKHGYKKEDAVEIISNRTDLQRYEVMSIIHSAYKT